MGDVTVVVPSWLIGIIVTACAAVVAYVLRGFFGEKAFNEWRASISADVKQLLKDGQRTDTALQLMAKDVGQALEKATNAENRANSQASAHNAAVKELRSEIHGRKP